MNLFHHVRVQVIEAVNGLVADGLLPAGAGEARFAVDPPRDPTHGDITTNAAMVLAGAAKRKPREIADALALRLRAGPEVAEVAVAGPGFVNLRLKEPFWHAALAAIVRAGPAYGDSFLGGGEPVNVEFVSANPTGPLHVGHGRGAVVGDALARLLAKAGWRVTREYYINDAGGQVNVLARSLHRRYREALGLPVGPPPEDFYPGEYLLPVAKAAVREFGARYAEAPEDVWREPFRAFAVEAMMAEIRGDLAALGLDLDVFTSERALVAAGKVEEAIAFLEEKGLVYTGVLEPPKGMKPEDWEPRPQTLFRSTSFGDDVDRPLRKSDGSWTYFASDIAYHLDKARRGFPLMIDVWGADHGGYVKRMVAAVKALTDGKGALDVKLCQLVAVLEGGQPVRMSKRAGNFVALRDVIERVGKDAVRFIMLTRKNDAALDFDLVKVTEQSRDNPVFYVQYAHARCRSVLRHAAGEYGAAAVAPEALAAAALQRLTDGDEVALIRTLAQWPRIVESAAEAHEPHRVAFYLYDLAAQFHALWNKGKDDADLRFLVRDDRALSFARLALVQGVAAVIASGLAVMGVTPLEELR